jgi:hypothetical protein
VISDICGKLELLKGHGFSRARAKSEPLCPAGQMPDFIFFKNNVTSRIFSGSATLILLEKGLQPIRL